MDKRKILFIWQSNWPWDIRIDKEIKSLQDKNYQIAIISRNMIEKPMYEVIDQVEIYRIPTFINNKQINNFLSTPFYLNPIWIGAILNAILKFKPDLVIIRDIPLSLSTIFFAKLFNIKTIIDMAEPYPALIKVNDKFMNNPITRFLFKDLDWYAHIEKLAVQQCGHIFVVVEDQIERLCQEYNISRNKITLVGNTPLLSTLNNKNFQTGSKLKIVYTGNVDGSFRDIPTVIRAISLIKNVPIEFNIVGTGSYIPKLKKLTEDLGVNNINFIGQLPFDKLLEFLKTQDIGIVPHDNSDYIKYTIPNKIFDYMAHSLPVIVPTVKPLERIVKETSCGYIYEVCNPESLANCFIRILENKNEISTKGINGYNAIKNKYNWENDSITMLNVINKYLENNYDFKN